MKDAKPQDDRAVSGLDRSSADGNRAALAGISAPAGRRITLSEALGNNWLEIWYQPKIDLRRKHLLGAEATARVRHPQHGVLPLMSFQVDERSLGELAHTALLAAFADWAAFEETGFNLRLSINVPLGILAKLSIPRLVAQHRPQSKRWPGFVLELTADEVARAAADCKDLAAKMRVTGVSIAIDHFGAGYVSMASLRDLPFAELKIHHSFVTGCAADASAAAICQTAIDLAHRFGSVAVAEGIERASDLQALVAMGCDSGQGALIAPPMPKQQLLERLRSRMRNKRGPAASRDSAASAPAVGRVA